MMEGFYGWIRNIVFYMIFITVITNLLPSGKYEKYLRLFSGCILILLVIQPLTGTFRLDEQITAFFHSFSFENDMGELSKGIDQMEEKRMKALIGQYEQTAAGDIKRLAAMEGLEAKEVSVQIAGDQSSPDFGKLKKVTVVLAGQGGTAKRPEADHSAGHGKAEEPAAQKVDVVDPVNIKVDLGDSENPEREEPGRGETGTGQEKAEGHEAGAGQKAGGKAGGNRQAAAAAAETVRLRQQISGCYQVEERNVEIKLEDD